MNGPKDELIYGLRDLNDTEIRVDTGFMEDASQSDANSSSDDDD